MILFKANIKLPSSTLLRLLITKYQLSNHTKLPNRPKYQRPSYQPCNPLTQAHIQAPNSLSYHQNAPHKSHDHHPPLLPYGPPPRPQPRHHNNPPPRPHYSRSPGPPPEKEAQHRRQSLRGSTEAQGFIDSSTRREGTVSRYLFHVDQEC